MICIAMVAGSGGASGAVPAGSGIHKYRGLTGGLFDRQYVIASVAMHSGRNPIRDGAEVEIWFSRRKTRAGGVARSMGWSAHCNSTGGGLRIRARHLIPVEPAQTLIGCEAAAEREDRWLSRFFLIRPRWAIRRERLTLVTLFAVVTLSPGSAPPGPP